MKKIFITLAILFRSVLGISADPHLVVLPNGEVDLGDFEAADPQVREVFIKNTGNEPLSITKIFSGCTCTRVKYSSDSVEPGDSIPITVVFNGRDRKPGLVRKIIRISSNADNSVVGVLVKGRIVPPFQN